MSDTTTLSPGRIVDGVPVPAPGAWEIDPGHADVAFTGRHFMVTKVCGRFTDVRGTVHIAENMADSRVHVTIGMASVESGNPTRDDHLRSEELFDVARFPEARFRSTSVSWRGHEGVVTGNLTLHGVTRRVDLRVSFEGQVRDPWGGERAVFSASADVNREDYGITWNTALEAGGVLVSKDIRLSIDIETVLQTGVG